MEKGRGRAHFVQGKHVQPDQKERERGRGIAGGGAGERGGCSSAWVKVLP